MSAWEWSKEERDELRRIKMFTIGGVILSIVAIITGIVWFLESI
jgi:hypothetical protein